MVTAKYITEDLYKRTLATNRYLTDEQKREVFSENELKNLGTKGCRACIEDNGAYTVHYFVKTPERKNEKDENILSEQTDIFGFLKKGNA